MARQMQREESPWQRCAACARCGWWTGWLCLDEPSGFRNCKQFGKAFEDVKIICRGGKRVTLKRRQGETDDQMLRRAFPETKPAEANETVRTAPANSVNLFEM